MPYKDKDKQKQFQHDWHQERKKKTDFTNRRRPSRKEYQRRRKTDITNTYHEYKSTLKCSMCPESHPATLQFHHRNAGEKDFIISEAIRGRRAWSSILKEIQKCDVLCANCHAKLHYELAMMELRGTHYGPSPE